MFYRNSHQELNLLLHSRQRISQWKYIYVVLGEISFCCIVLQSYHWEPIFKCLPLAPMGFRGKLGHGALLVPGNHFNCQEGYPQTLILKFIYYMLVVKIGKALLKSLRFLWENIIDSHLKIHWTLVALQEKRRLVFLKSLLGLLYTYSLVISIIRPFFARMVHVWGGVGSWWLPSPYFGLIRQGSKYSVLLGSLENGEGQVSRAGDF